MTSFAREINTGQKLRVEWLKVSAQKNSKVFFYYSTSHSNFYVELDVADISETKA